ncbi:ABC transporter permease [Caloranaerobacter ferrireducens]|uniref:ABC transporter permease n=1 Tax=Caloranaerobacter ferrireducens TaxID=1323370 RepID=UPI00084D40C6|nr:ABC transporter permease [Caloranaerobacter ferrireducens]
MGIRKVILLALIVVLSFSSYMYLKEKYNPMAVELRFRGDLEKEEFQKIKKGLYLNVYSVNYSMRYKQHTLVMTTGMDTQLIDIPIIHGEFITDSERKVAVIGDKVADFYFKVEDAIGKRIKIFENEYEVIGIVKNSDVIYIPFNKKFFKLDWDKKIFRYVSYDKNVSYFKIDKVVSQLSALGLDVYDIVVYKEKIYGYINVIIFAILYVLFDFAMKLYRRIKRESITLLQGYMEKRRIKEWYEYILEEKKGILKILAHSTTFAFMVIGIFKMIPYLTISPSSIPDNIFSLYSILRVLKYKYSNLILHLNNGYSEIMIDVIIINTIFLLIIAGIALNIALKKVKQGKSF